MNLNILAPLNSTGYGLTSINLIKALCEAQHNVSLWPINVEENTFQQYPVLSSCINKTKTEYDPDAPSLRIWHQFDMSVHVGNGLNCGFTIFELPNFNELEKKHLSSLDRLFVPSLWAVNVVKENKIDTAVHTLPLGVDTDIFKHHTNWNRNEMRSQLGFKEDDYIFFNAGKWEVRKGHDVLLDIFNKAFPNKNAKLIMACYNPCISPEENQPWFDMYKDERILCIPNRLQSQLDLAKLMFISDCGVFVSRAEGFNLELAEMLAMDKPVITTNYAAHTYFCNKENSYLVDIDELEPAYDGRWFFGNSNWAKLGEKQLDSFVEYMRYCYSNNIRENKNDVKEVFTWKNSAMKLVQALT